jgi:hypothetical protein
MTTEFHNLTLWKVYSFLLNKTRITQPLSQYCAIISHLNLIHHHNTNSRSVNFVPQYSHNHITHKLLEIK